MLGQSQSNHLSATDDLAFGLAEYRSRVAAFQQAMAIAEVDVLLATTPEHINYIAGFDPLGIYLYQALIINQSSPEPVMVTHKCEAELARTQAWIGDIQVWEHGDDPMALTASCLRKAGARAGSRIGLEMGNWYLNVEWVERLRALMPDVEFVDATALGQEVRIIKSAAEIDYLRQAAAFADLGFQTAVDHLRAGVSEIGLCAAILAEMTAAGSEYAALPMIIASGERSGFFHAAPSRRQVRRGDPVMFEISGVARRYNSNIVRTVVAGTASPQLRALGEIVYEAFWTPFELVRPGNPVSDVDRLSRQIRAGYAKYIPARAGFGMGLAYPPVWLGRPDILVGDPHVFEPGMVFSLEPSIAQYEGISVIYGYNILVTDDGAEILHKTPRDLFEVD